MAAKKPASSTLYHYVCKVLEWTDGDTCKVEIDLGFGLAATKTVRVYGINAKEMRSKDVEEAKLGIKAMHYAQYLAPPSSYALVRTHKSGKEKFGRWLATIQLRDGRDFANTMLAEGHASIYLGR